SLVAWPAGQHATTHSLVVVVYQYGRILHAELHHEFRSLPIALPGIPTPTLENPEVVIEDDLLEFVGRVTPPGDVQHRVLDPGASDVAAIDQLRIQNVPLWIETEPSLITPEAHTVDCHLPPTSLGRRRPRLLYALEATLGMKHIQDAG